MSDETEKICVRCGCPSKPNQANKITGVHIYYLFCIESLQEKVAWLEAETTSFRNTLLTDRNRCCKELEKLDAVEYDAAPDPDYWMIRLDEAINAVRNEKPHACKSDDVGRCTAENPHVQCAAGFGMKEKL